ncbi:Ig-like domain-containing surface protein [Desulfitobacterium dichloroeliminans LMG P-21439]|uniref:Ig-like domain-containing surface protein n=1 Tax=Desulfitobacterium dichloroeliminans (strain LMG P-21439 / DCA1) TaxID=871963 RepID=L0FBH5_DESDL|nr:Ig-like domain-containing protein [Desulfitobacterium dichloroeliminans]AGA70557.1 Ig-like domain-containing surface protein [Desulfitobacterium dichloroeliminans LMG P-21439]
MKRTTKALFSTICMASLILTSSLPVLASPPSWAQSHEKSNYSISEKTKDEQIQKTYKTHKVSSIILKKRMYLKVGESSTLAVKIAPKKANQKVTWESSNTAVATVDSNGKVVGVSAGRAYVTATAEDGSKKKTCRVTVANSQVTDVTKVTGVTLSPSTLNLSAGGSTGVLTATVSPSSATNKKVTWTSSNLAVATVNTQGVVTPLAQGVATITATTVDGLKTAQATVNIVAQPIISNVKISSNNADTTKAMNGDTIILTFTSSVPVTKLSNFKINGSNPDTFTQVGNVYTATHLVDSGDLITGVPATFQINVQNAAGIYSQTIEATSNSSAVTIINKYARISKVTIASDNVIPTKATLGDVITLKFTTDEAITKLSNFKINSSNPDSFVEVYNSDGTYTYTAKHLVDSGDRITRLPATFLINVQNAAGIYSPTIEKTSDGTSVTIQ